VSIPLSIARNEVRALLDEPNPQFWSNAQLNSWLNQGAQSIARQAQALWMQTSVPAVALQQTYNLPLDFLGVHRLDFNMANSNQTYNLEFRGIKAMDEIWGILQQLPAAFPQAFYLWNKVGSPNTGYFGTYPVVGGTGTFILYYYRNSVPAIADTDLIDVTPAYEDLAIEYCIFKAKRADRDPTWQEAKAVFDAELQIMFDKTARFSDQGDQFTSGTPNWPLYLYTDTANWY
jgi:hypothetical protein